jgi:hypothetical protein
VFTSLLDGVLKLRVIGGKIKEVFLYVQVVRM